MQDFHEVRFPLDVALGARGGPVRRTDIVAMASGREHRNARWEASRRRYDAGLGVRSLDALAVVIAFFEERRGRLVGFRLHDRTDAKSCAPSATPAPGDQALGTGDGARTAFQLVKRYGGAHLPWVRTIAKPVAGSVRVAVAGVELMAGLEFAVDATTGLVTLATPPPAGASVSAGYAFDVPVRFDTDALEIDLSAFAAGAVPQIPIVEIVP
ncbi:TIGR02217 family protein [Salinarimonas sp.]|uniref:phage distal tail protein, Rcc01695 family n=1 Tax=Salinarimonas sp. TaxID=2766526 RepID=UPI00391B2648